MKKLMAILLICLLLASMATCAGAEDVIKIGLYSTITGSNALAGEMMEKGGQLAIKQVNAAGGIGGVPLELVVYDDKSTPEGAVKAVTRLVDVDQVIAIVGSNSSPNILAGAPITEEAGVIQVGGGTSPSYTNAGFKYIFRGTTNARLPNKAFVDAMVEMGATKVGILSVASEYGKSGVGSVKELLPDSIQVVAEEIYQSTDTDYTGQIAKIISSGTDAVVLYGMTNELALAIKQLRRNGYDGYIYGPEGLGVPDIINVAGEAANNVIFGSGAVIPATIEDAVNDVEKKMLEDFVAEYGQMPVSDVVYRGFDSVMLIAQALKTAGDIHSPDSIREAFLNITDFPGIAGHYNFSDGSGDGLSQARTYIISGGKNALFDAWKAAK
ncbi:MAG: ABC transporter substrate-binding protein [Christensenellaceae bacterium]|nr:ABC transporter substrate-binding protein [Christensenellaceae bacterium]